MLYLFGTHAYTRYVLKIFGRNTCNVTPLVSTHCRSSMLVSLSLSLSQDLSRQLQQVEGRVRSLEQEVMRLVSASGVLAGCVLGLRRQVCALVWQKAVLQERVCGADVLRSEVSRLLQALGDGGVKGRGVCRFRRCVIAVLAAGRLRALGCRSAVMFRVALGFGLQPLVSVNRVKLGEEEEKDDEDDGNRVMKTLASSELLKLIHTCMEGLQQELNRSGEKHTHTHTHTTLSVNYRTSKASSCIGSIIKNRAEWLSQIKFNMHGLIW